MTDIIGQTFGDYRVEAAGETREGLQLFVARHVRLDRLVSLLLLDAALSADPEVQPRFLPAIRVAAALQHPHIVEIYDFNIQSGRFYLAQELLGGGTLRALLRRQGGQIQSLALGVALLRQAAEGVAYAHGRSVVHGNITPDDMLLAGQANASAQGADTLKVGGFGLGLLRQASPDYAAPELLRGQRPDARSDVYALGAVLYELVTGSLPRSSAPGARALPPSPRALQPQIPEALDAIILRCLAPRPEDRYPDGAALAAALRQVLPALSPAQTVAFADLPTQRAPQPPPQLAPRLRVLDATGALLHVGLISGSLTLGRGAESPILLDSDQISRQHLRVDWDGRQVTVMDLGSTNGTLLDGQRLPPNSPRPWPWRATVQAGPFRLQLEPPPGSDAPTVVAGADPLLATLLAGVPPAAATTQAVGGERLAVRLEQEQLTIEPGQPAFLSLMVANRGTTPDLATISVEGLPVAWVRLPAQPVQLPPGGQAAVSLTISVPRDATSASGTYPVVVRARSSANPAESGTALGRWTVQAFSASRVAITPRRAEGGASASYQIFIANEGNAPVDYQLAAIEHGEPMRLVFGQDRVMLQPGEEITIGLVASAQRPLFGGEVLRPFEVEVSGGDEPPHLLEASLVQQPRVALWVPLALLALLLFGLLLRSLLGQPGDTVGGIPPLPTLLPTQPSPTASPTPTPEPGAPEVALFEAQPNVVAPGQPLVVSWDVRNAERVAIDQFGDVPPQGSQEHRIDQTTDYRLVAYGGGKETVRIARVFVMTPTVVATQAPPTAVPPTGVPPTGVPPTGVPPTAVPPTAVPPTAVPPTGVPPTAVPPTAVPPTAVPPLNLQDQAPQASWLTDAGGLAFGAPQPDPTTGAQVGFVGNVALEDGRSYPSALFTLPPTRTEGFVEGQFNLPAIQPGQFFLASVGFEGNTPVDAALQVQVSFSGELIYSGTVQADGGLDSISVDLTPYVGRAGQLTLRVTTVADGERLYWLRPRVALA